MQVYEWEYVSLSSYVKKKKKSLEEHETLIFQLLNFGKRSRITILYDQRIESPPPVDSVICLERKLKRDQLSPV